MARQDGTQPTGRAGVPRSSRSAPARARAWWAQIKVHVEPALHRLHSRLILWGEAVRRWWIAARQAAATAGSESGGSGSIAREIRRRRAVAEAITQRLPTIEARQTFGRLTARTTRAGELWRDVRNRQWLAAAGGAIIVAVLLLLVAPAIGRWGLHPAPAPPAAQPTAPTEQPPAVPVQPEQPSLPAGTTPARAPLSPGEVGLRALPLLLGLFWLLSAWLVDSEARRAFVIQEPWGERRTVAYSCLAIGCVFPLILAGLIFAAYGFVAFVQFVAVRAGIAAGVRAGAAILLAFAVLLLLRSALARLLAARRGEPY